MVQRIDFRPAIATPAPPNEPSVDAVPRTDRSQPVSLTPALLSLRDPRLMPLLLRRRRAAQAPAPPQPGRKARVGDRGARRREDGPLGRNVDLAA